MTFTSGDKEFPSENESTDSVLDPVLPTAEDSSLSSATDASSVGDSSPIGPHQGDTLASAATPHHIQWKKPFITTKNLVILSIVLLIILIGIILAIIFFSSNKHNSDKSPATSITVHTHNPTPIEVEVPHKHH